MNEEEVLSGVSAFERRYGNLYRSLYRGDEPFKASFRDQSWRFVLKTLSFEWNPAEFNTICDAIRRVGDTQMVWTNLQFAPPNSLSCVLPLSYEAYVQAMRKEELRWLHAGRKAIFGPSGCWAAIADEATYFAGGFCMIGGTATFIDHLVRLSGGIERMRGDFLGLLDDTTAAVPYDLRERLLEDVGW